MFDDAEDDVEYDDLNDENYVENYDSDTSDLSFESDDNIPLTSLREKNCQAFLRKKINKFALSPILSVISKC